MASISRLFPELEKSDKLDQERSPSFATSSDDEACNSSINKPSSSSSNTSSNGDGAANDSSCDSGRVSTPASFEGGCCDDQIYEIKSEKKNNFRPWENTSTDKHKSITIKEEHCTDLGSLHHNLSSASGLSGNPAQTQNPFAAQLGQLGSHLGVAASWALNYPTLLQHQQLQQQQLLHQFLQTTQFAQNLATQQKNIQAYNAFRLQSQMNAKPKKPSVESLQSSVGSVATSHSCNHSHSHSHDHCGGNHHQPEKMDTTPSEKAIRSKDKKDNCSKPYKCPICEAQFNRPANLKTHLRIHSGEKPYKCDTCSARFVQVAHLRAHILIHTGEKPYPCQVCGTRFRHLQTLKSHIRIHTGEKPFSCDECDLKFRHKSQLRLHLRTKHNINTNTKKSYTFVPGLNSADLSKIIKDSNKTPVTSNMVSATSS